MVLFGAGEKLAEEEKSKERKRCAMYVTALEGCQKANTEPEACKNLRQSLLSCYGEKHAQQEAAEHRKCYTTLYKMGIYKGLGHCKPYEEAMEKALAKKGLVA